MRNTGVKWGKEHCPRVSISTKTLIGTCRVAFLLRGLGKTLPLEKLFPGQSLAHPLWLTLALISWMFIFCPLKLSPKILTHCSPFLVNFISYRLTHDLATKRKVLSLHSGGTRLTVLYVNCSISIFMRGLNINLFFHIMVWKFPSWIKVMAYEVV